MNEQRASREAPLLGRKSAILAASSGATGYTRRGRGRTPLARTDEREPVARRQTPRLVWVGEANDTLIYKNTADAGPGYLVRPAPDGNPPSLTQIHQLDISVRTVTQTDEQDTFTFSTSSEAYFVIATPAFPGWTADLDGHPVLIQQIAGVLPAIKVGPGTHTLSYTYDPSSVHFGAMLSVLGLLAALAWLVAGRLWKPRKIKAAT